MNRYTITAYSATAGIFLLHSNVTDAQMVHVNVDPDAHVGPYFDYNLDLNADGINEVFFNCGEFWTGSSFGGEFHGYSSQWIYLYPTGTFATSIGQIKHLVVGDTVDADMLFNDVDPLFFYGQRDIIAGGGWVDIVEGSEWVNNEGFFGLKFPIDGETHYGWIRVELIQLDPDYLPQMYVKEFAYNDTPDAPAPITIYNADIAKSLVLSDIGETNTPEDLQLTFNKADNEITVSEYRVALFKGAIPPTVAQIDSLTPDRYISVFPTGDDLSVSFSADILDINGDTIIPGYLYRAIVLSVADGTYAIESDLSVPSNYTYFSLDVAPATYEVELLTDSIATDISGFIGSFGMMDTSVSAVRLYITANEMNVEELLALDEPYYMETIPVVGINTVHFTSDKLIYEAGDPALFNLYYLHVVSIPDSITNSIPALSVQSGRFLYNQYPVAPEITIIGYAGNSSDILLEFPQLPDEASLEVYRVFVCKAGTVVNSELVAGMLPIHYESVYPSGVDLHMDLTACNLDSDGDEIIEGQPYVAYVAMRCTCDDYFYSITIPSSEFILGEPEVGIDNMATDELIITDNVILIPNGLESSTLQISNASGQMMFEYMIQSGDRDIKLPPFPAGIYIAYIKNEQHIYAKKFVITSSGG